MKRLAAVVALVLLVALAPPADAGWGYWSPSPCREDIEWYRTSAGVYYWQYGWSEYNGAKLVPVGYFLDTYATYGYECGFLGAPRSNKVCLSATFSYVQFQGGQITRNAC